MSDSDWDSSDEETLETVSQLTASLLSGGCTKDPHDPDILGYSFEKSSSWDLIAAHEEKGELKDGEIRWHMEMGKRHFMIKVQTKWVSWAKLICFYQF